MLTTTIINLDNVKAADMFRKPIENGARPPFQLWAWSSPYPGLRGFDVSVEDYLGAWLPARLGAWLPLLDQRRGVYAQVIRFPRNSGWFDLRVFNIGQILESFGLKIIDVAIWDKLNAPPAGNHARHDRNAYELIFLAAFTADYIYRPFREDYAKSTILKAASGNMRQPDIFGNMAGGHSKLNEAGAAQDNIYRSSPTGEKKRPRVAGGSFPRYIARRLIKQYTDPGDHVLDPCVGAGTVLIQAIRLNRSATGIDVSPKAYQTAVNWVENELAKLGGSSSYHRQWGSVYTYKGLDNDTIK